MLFYKRCFRAHSLPVLSLLLQSCRPDADDFSVHVEDLKVLFLDLNDDADGLSVQLDHVSKLELAQRVDAGGHVGAELEVARQHFQLGQVDVGEQDNHVLLDTHNQTGVSLVTSTNHFHVVALQACHKI